MIFVGVILAILAAGIGTTSKQLIAASEHLKKPWLFHLGASMNIALGPVVDASAYAFAPQVIVAPFACLDVIFNALTAPYTLHWQNERLSRNHIRGTALVALGAVFTSVFAAVDNKVYTVRELEEQLFLRPTSFLYMLIELFAITLVNIALKKKWLSPKVRGISLGVIAGILMGNVFFLKGLIGIITTTASTGEFDAWLRPTPYILAAAAGAGAVTGHIFMRKGLGEYKGVFMVTIFEGAHISAACLSGCVVMEEMVGAPFWQYIAYWGSVSCIVGGMLVINLAAAEAQIEGKFHIAQSFAEVPLEDEASAREPTIGLPLEDIELGTTDSPSLYELKGSGLTPNSPWPGVKIDDGDEDLSSKARNGGYDYEKNGATMFGRPAGRGPQDSEEAMPRISGPTEKAGVSKVANGG
mmetsp:Transcript_36371/g.103486  ORF Transcript_36371/g.103486 Transcript_36371/m.103486 type:complete len:412 (+) Transcript_36371:119-1354(+)